LPSILKRKLKIMAQSAVTVRIDSEIKSQFDKVCEQIGMSANTAFNVFVKAVVRTRSIPFEIKAAPKAESMSGLEAFYALRAEAQKNGLQDMTLDEINEEIRLAREERRAKMEKK
jgi:DNA-damage-inducible protein J